MMFANIKTKFIMMFEKSGNKWNCCYILIKDWVEGPSGAAPRSSDLSPIKFAFWEFLKPEACVIKIRYLHHIGSRPVEHSAL